MAKQIFCKMTMQCYSQGRFEDIKRTVLFTVLPRVEKEEEEESVSF